MRLVCRTRSAQAFWDDLSDPSSTAKGLSNSLISRGFDLVAADRLKSAGSGARHQILRICETPQSRTSVTAKSETRLAR
jgi:hypothetical protein